VSESHLGFVSHPADTLKIPIQLVKPVQNSQA